MSPIVLADTYTVTVGENYGPYQTGLGGEFTLFPSANLTWVLDSYVNEVTQNVVNGISPNFQTFCLEKVEYIYKNTTYEVVISDRATYGGKGEQGGGDPISKGTAWLYHEFQLGRLTGLTLAGDYYYDYNNNDHTRKKDADYLQKAFWWLEEEGINYDANNPFMYKVYQMWGDDAKSDNNGLYPVAVLNLWVQGHVGEWGYRRQDQLVCIPAEVPEPGTFLLIGAGFLGLGAKFRRRKK